jgi:hypothetical protein
MDRGPSPLPLNGPNSLSSYELYIRTLKPPALSRLKLIDTELQRLVYFIVRDFVSSWYSSVSTHDEFYSEVVQSLASVLAKIEARLLEVCCKRLELKPGRRLTTRNLYSRSISSAYPSKSYQK